MRTFVPVLFVVATVGCNKDKQEVPAATGSASTAEKAADPAPPAPTPAPTPAPPPLQPVKLTKEELNPTCAKLFPPDVAAKTHGATEVKEDTARGPLAICQFMKGGESLGSVTVACNPDLDPTAIDRERGAMTKAVDLPAPVGRGGYRISNSFVIIDDETPCRIMASYMTPAEGPAMADALRAIVAAVNPSTLK